METVEHDENTSSLSESESAIEAVSNRSNQRKTLKPNRKPRREVWWLDLGTNNHSLTSVGQCFEDRLNWSLLSSSNPLLHHIRSPKDDNLRRSLHQCPGYLREEIALTCDLSKSVIVSHTFPGLSERCSICHQLVQYLPTPIQPSQQDDALAQICPTNNSSAIHARYKILIGIYSIPLTLHSGSIFHHANNIVVHNGAFYADHNLIVKQVQSE